MKTTITTAQAMSHPDVALTINTLGQMADGLRVDHDALKEAARLALDALEKSTRYFNIVRLGESRLKDSEVRGDCHTAMNALKAVL